MLEAGHDFKGRGKNDSGHEMPNILALVKYSMTGGAASNHRLSLARQSPPLDPRGPLSAGFECGSRLDRERPNVLALLHETGFCSPASPLSSLMLMLRFTFFEIFQTVFVNEQNCFFDKKKTKNKFDDGVKNCTINF